MYQPDLITHSNYHHFVIQLQQYISDANKVREVIFKAGSDLRHRWPILQYQNLIGSLILAISLISMIVTGSAYYHKTISAMSAILFNAFWASLIHEIEHDTIHQLYFKTSPIMANVIMGLVWIARPNALNPWFRRKLHLHHHKFSGSEADIEERLISLGMNWNLVRVFIIIDQVMTVISRPIGLFTDLIPKWLKTIPKEENRFFLVVRGFGGLFPGLIIYASILYTFIIYHLSSIIIPMLGYGMDDVWSHGIIDGMIWINFISVVWIWPNFLRSFCLQFIRYV
jgi:fatty acid desaturase